MTEQKPFSESGTSPPDFNAVVEAALPKLRRAARDAGRWRVADDLADDAVQDGVVRVWQRAPWRELDAGHLTAVLVLAVKDSARNIVRGRVRLRLLEQEYGEWNPPAALPHQDGGSFILDLEKAVGELLKDQREAVALALTGHTVSEIGELAGVPRSVAGRTARAGLDALRETLAGFGWEAGSLDLTWERLDRIYERRGTNTPSAVVME